MLFRSILCLLGTFLVRSGILQSIHAFGASTLGVPFIVLITVPTFLKKYYKQNLNIKNGFILNNTIHTRGHHDNRLISKHFFEQAPIIGSEIYAHLKIRDFWGGNGMKTILEINNQLHLNLSLVNYMRIGTALTHYFYK